VGQLAWIAEQFHEWSTAPIDRDRIVTNLMLYWLTGTAGSSPRLYYENMHAGDWPQPSPVPTRVAVFTQDVSIRRYAEQDNKIVHWSEFERGHFAALEAPDLLVVDVRAFSARCGDVAVGPLSFDRSERAIGSGGSVRPGQQAHGSAGRTGDARAAPCHTPAYGSDCSSRPAAASASADRPRRASRGRGRGCLFAYESRSGRDRRCRSRRSGLVGMGDRVTALVGRQKIEGPAAARSGSATLQLSAS
jgi:hypothetical protein